MNVLSLFDGISGGKVALDRLGMKCNYYASEIDKYAIKISKNNNLYIIQLGNIESWKEWNLPNIDLIIGGFPCQGFSKAGLGLNFNDVRSKLFFVCVDILKFYKPKYFLLENVQMKKEYRDLISELVGVEPITIDSALLSAQSRKRLYWTNIQNIQQPEDKGILLKDIIETGIVDRDKAYAIDANYYKGGSLRLYFDMGRRQIVKEEKYESQRRLMVQVGIASEIHGKEQWKRVYSPDGKSPTLVGWHHEPKISEDLVTWRKLTPLECERLQTYTDGYTIGVSNTQRYKALGNSFTVDVISHILKNMEF